MKIVSLIIPFILETLRNIFDYMGNENSRIIELENELKQSIKNLEKEKQKIIDELNNPVKEIKQKIKYVNNLKLKINYTNKVLLLGNKGAGKSTYLWLINVGNKPEPSLKDGTTKLEFHKDYIDTIGIIWSYECLLKLIVLLLYTEFPSDIIIFNNDRVMQPITLLASVGIIHPIIIILHSNFWKLYNKGKIELDNNNYVKDKDDLEYIYNLDAYNKINELNIGLTVTHQDDINKILNNRKNNSIKPFKNIIENIGEIFIVNEENNNPTISCLFRFIYIYDKKYKNFKNGMQLFLNNATLSEF